MNKVYIHVVLESKAEGTIGPILMVHLFNQTWYDWHQRHDTSDLYAALALGCSNEVTGPTSFGCASNHPTCIKISHLFLLYKFLCSSHLLEGCLGHGEQDESFGVVIRLNEKLFKCPRDLGIFMSRPFVRVIFEGHRTIWCLEGYYRDSPSIRSDHVRHLQVKVQGVRNWFVSVAPIVRTCHVNRGDVLKDKLLGHDHNDLMCPKRTSMADFVLCIIEPS